MGIPSAREVGRSSWTGAAVYRFWRELPAYNGSDQIRSTATAVGVDVGTVPEFHKASDIGATFGAGIEFKAGWLRVTPEFRYTRWGSENFDDPIGALLRTNKNQGDFMLGLTF